MKTIELVAKSIDEVHKLGVKHLLTWCYFYKSEEQRSSSLLASLIGEDFGELSTCLVMVRIQDNPWVGVDMSMPSKLPELICFSCGGGICRVNDIDELEDAVAMARNMGEQLHSSWLAQAS